MRFFFISFLLVAVSLSLGCNRGPYLYKVSGEVTCDGVPLTDGEISLVPEEIGVAADGASIINGHFDLLAKPGKKKVVIRASRVMAKPPLGANLANPPREDFIPSRFNDLTLLRAEVKTDSGNQFKFEVSSK